MSAAFYCVADERYFLGAVGLVNSLRLVGHDEPVFLLDCGLTDSQRALLERETEIVEMPSEAAPTMLKTIAPLRRPAETMVLIDTDMIATRSLAPLIEQTAAGKVVAARNDTDRHLPEWGDLLELGELRRHPYVSFGLVALGGPQAVELLELIDDRQRRVDFERTYWREQRITPYPFLFADQDVLNAVLAARLEPGELVALDGQLAPLPPFQGLRVVDERTLRCAHADGTEPYVVHHWLAKPWLEPTHEGVYSQLLRRLLVRDDVAIQVPAEEIPPWLRRGPRAWAERKLINLRERRKAATA